MAKEMMLIGDGVRLSPEDDGSYTVNVKPSIRELSSTGKSHILAKTAGGYAALGANRKLMVVLIETHPKTSKGGGKKES
jgi:hypothetical protein